MNRKQISMVLLSVALSVGSVTAIAQAPGFPAGTAGPNSGSFSGWLSDYQTKNQGKVSRQAYMDEVGRRWDQADTSKQGLTVEQINRTYGLGATGVAGVSTAPGNMGPNNVKK